MWFAGDLILTSADSCEITILLVGAKVWAGEFWELDLLGVHRHNKREQQTGNSISNSHVSLFFLYLFSFLSSYFNSQPILEGCIYLFFFWQPKIYYTKYMSFIPGNEFDCIGVSC